MTKRILLQIADGLRDEAKSSNSSESNLKLNVANEMIKIDIALHGITFGEARSYEFTPKKDVEGLPNPFPRS